MLAKGIGVALAATNNRKGRRFFVDSSAGSDSNNGRSTTTPWASITKVNTVSLQPGDKVLFKRGLTYGVEALTPISSGLQGNPITFGAYGTGAAPKICRYNTLVGLTARTAPARTFSETFAATGYDNVWGTPVLGAGSILDPDALSSDVGSPLGWGTQCLKAVSTGAQCSINKTLTTAALSYTRLEVVVTDSNIPVSSFSYLAYAWSGATTVWRVGLTRTSSGLRFLLTMNQNGASTTFTGSYKVFYGDMYRIEVKYNATGNVWEWRINGITQNTGTLTTGRPANITDLSIGAGVSTPQPCTVYLGPVAFGTVDWHGPNSGVYQVTTSAVPKVGRTPDNKFYQPVGSVSALCWPGEFFKDSSSGILYIAAASAPASFDYSTGSRALYVNGLNYVNFEDLHFQFADSSTMEFEGATNITVRRCEMSYAYYSGAMLQGTTQTTNLTIDACIVHDVGQHGLDISASQSSTRLGSVTLKNNDITRACLNYGIDPTVDTNFSDNAGIKVMGLLATTALVSGNIIYGCGPRIMGLNDDGKGAGIWVDSWGGVATVTGNRVRDNDGAGIIAELSDDTVISYNFVYRNGNKYRNRPKEIPSGILLYRGSKTCQIYHNTVYNNYNTQIKSFGEPGTGAEGLDEACDNNIIRDNIAQPVGTAQRALAISGDTTARFDGNSLDKNCFGPEQTAMFEYGVQADFGATAAPTYNLLSTFATAFQSVTGDADTRSVVLSPLFTNAGQGDFTLQPGSPCIGTASDSGNIGAA